MQHHVPKKLLIYFLYTLRHKHSFSKFTNVRSKSLVADKRRKSACQISDLKKNEILIYLPHTRSTHIHETIQLIHLFSVTTRLVPDITDSFTAVTDSYIADLFYSGMRYIILEYKTKKLVYNS